MNAQTRFGFVVTALIGASLFFTACSDPQKVARKSVEAKGYELNVKDLLVAAAAGDVAGLEQFQAAGFDMDSVDPAGNTALIKAAGAGQTEAVERLLGMGADPRKVNEVGRDALLAASAKGYEEVARLLLGRGADTTVRDREGWGALSIAAFNGHANVVSLLASNATPAELDDALLVSSFSGDAKVIDTLLGHGANINARSPESKTPLMIASEAGKLEAVRTLLQNQANPFAVDLNNQTAANLALSAGHENVSQLITHPDQWGKSPEGEKLAGEMESARSALEGEGVEETLLDGKPLQGEPNRDLLVKKSEPGTPVAPATVAGGSSPVPSGAVTAGEGPAKAAESAAPVVAATRPAQSEGTTAGEGTAPREPIAGGTVAQTALRATPVGEAAPSPETKQARIETSRQVREASKTKPIVALNGSTIHSRFPEQAPVKTMVLAAYHEESLPLVVDGVSGSTASVRRLDQTSGSIAVEKGAVIPGTPYKVKEVTPRFVSSKEGKGRMVDVSRVEVEDTKSGSTHTLVKDTSGQTADTYAILTAPNSQYRYVVKAGDVFRTTQPDIGAKDYQVLDIRANAVVIKDLATEEVTTVARDGVIQP
jgi:ankyrin repeat protein